MSSRNYCNRKKPSERMKRLRKEALKYDIRYRSGLEIEVQLELKNSNQEYQYEPYKLKYTKPSTEHTYTPDIVLPNGILIEIKGEFTAADRKKHLWVRQCHPELDIRFLFGNPKQKLTKRKGSQSYAQWCDKQGFLWAKAPKIPRSWL